MLLTLEGSDVSSHPTGSGQAAVCRVGGPVVWMVPSGNRKVSSPLGPSSRVQSLLWILVWWMLHTGMSLPRSVRG